MSIFEKAIGAISPRWAYARQCWRTASRTYDAGGAMGARGSAWAVANRTAEQANAPDRDRLRARARDMECNSDMLSSILRALERNVVGWGLQLQPDTGNEKTDEIISTLFEQWRVAANCDVAGRNTFDELCQMIVRRECVDGGILIALRQRQNAPPGIVPLQMQLIEVDALETVTAQPHNDGAYIVDGIEVDITGRPLGYWIKQQAPSSAVVAPMSSVYLPASAALFYFRPTRPGQIREVSRLAITLNRIRDMEEYMNAVSVKERISACLSVFVKKALPSSGGIGRSRSVEAGIEPYTGKRLYPGMIQELQPGEDVSVVEPANGGASAAEYLRLQQRSMGAGMGLSYEVSTRDMSQVTYSSARQGLLEDNVTYAMEQQSLIDHVLRPIYEAFVECAYLASLLNLPQYETQRAMCLRHDWTPQGRGWIDPLKEANANTVALSNGLKTYAEIAGERGRDWRQMLKQIKLERDYAKSLGVDIFGHTAKEPDAGPDADPDESGNNAAGDDDGAGNDDEHGKPAE